VAAFLDRLQAAPCAASFETAYRLLCDTLNGVENEFTDIPYKPDAWESDGRLYPPQRDSMRAVGPAGTVRRFRSRGHYTYIATNGAIEIREVHGGGLLLTKPGANGLGVWHTEPTKDNQ